MNNRAMPEESDINQSVMMPTNNFLEQVVNHVIGFIKGKALLIIGAVLCLSIFTISSLTFLNNSR